MITRRGLFGILAGAVAAPIVVRSGLLMPVKALVVPEPLKIEIAKRYTITVVYPADAFYFIHGDIIEVSGFNNPPDKLDLPGFSALRMAA